MIMTIAHHKPLHIHSGLNDVSGDLSDLAHNDKDLGHSHSYLTLLAGINVGLPHLCSYNTLSVSGRICARSVKRAFVRSGTLTNVLMAPANTSFTDRSCGSI